jgi:hypothetical protein
MSSSISIKNKRSLIVRGKKRFRKRILLRLSDPGLEHFKDEEIVLVDEIVRP